MSYHALMFLLLVVVLSIGMLEISVALTVRLLLPTTELVGIGHSLSADQYNVTLLSVLDKHAPAAKSRVTERMSSPWFGLVREDLLESKRIRRQAERKWRNTNLTVFKDLYKKAKHHVTKVVLKAKKLYYNSNI